MSDYDEDQIERDRIESELSEYVCFDCKTVRFLCQCPSTCPNYDCGRPRWHIMVEKDGYVEFIWRCEVCGDESPDEW
jgi:hypothetical protein